MQNMWTVCAAVLRQKSELTIFLPFISYEHNTKIIYMSNADIYSQIFVPDQ